MNWFIKTCERDREWLSYCLRSLAKFDPEGRAAVVVDAMEHARWAPELGDYWMSYFSVPGSWPEAEKIANPYIRQQYVKLNADRVFAVALHVQIDSDCMLLRSPVEADFFREGKPVWWYDRWEEVGAANCWRAPTEAALGMSVPFEHMRRPGFMIEPGVLAEVRRRIELVHGMELVDYLAGVRTFSEYNCIGAIGTPAYQYVQAKGNDVWGVPGSPLIHQGWGFKPMPADWKAKAEEILR